MTTIKASGRDLELKGDQDIVFYPTDNIWISQGTKLIFEGTVPDDHEAKLQATAVTADRDIILPDASGTITLNEKLSDGTFDMNVNSLTVTGSGATSVIQASQDIELDAAGAVIVKDTPLRLASLTTTQRNALTPVNGDMIYNTTTNKIEMYTNGAWGSSASIEELVDNAPGTLDTLNELAAALGDDPNFATTVTNSLAGKLENVVEDTTPELGGSLVTAGNRITHAASGNVSHMNFTTTQFGQNNNTVLSSVKSIHFFLDSNGGDSSQAFRIYNNVDPDNLGVTTESDYIFKVLENGDVNVTGKILLPDGSVSANYAGFGNADDLKIFHNGTHSIVRETGTGDLHLQSDNNVILSKDTDTEIMVKGIADGAVELYHNNIKKFETTSSGVAVTGNITVSGTVDGVDIATRDSTLTSTTTTANAALPKAGGTMAGVINMGSNKVTNVTDPTAAQDAATKSYVDTQVAGAGGGGSFVSFGYAQGGGTSTSTLFRFSTPISLPAGHTIVGWSTHEPAPAVSWRDNYQGSTTILGTGSYTNSGGSAVNVYAWCNTSNSNTRGVSYIIFG